MNKVLEDWASLNVDEAKTKKEFDDLMGDYDTMISKAGYDLPSKIPYFLNEMWDVPWDYMPFFINVLDLCCGTGLIGRVLNKWFPDSYITGIDYSNNIEIAAKHKDVYDILIQQNVYNLPKFKNKFNLVTMIGSLTYFNPKTIFNEINEKVNFEQFLFSHRVDLIDKEFEEALSMFVNVRVIENVPYLPDSEFYKDKPVNIYMVEQK